METTTLKSGHVLSLALAPFSVGNKLRKVIAAELRLVAIDIDNLKIDLGKDVKLNELDAKALNTMKNVVCQLASSDAVEACFFECAARCLIDGQGIKRETFDPADMRGDFLPAVWEVVRFNLAPFFAGIDLKSLISDPAKTAGQQ